MTAEASQLGAMLIELCAKDMLEFRCHADAFRVDVPERPVASDLARLQSASSSQVANMQHRTVELTAVGRHLIGWLDGKNDRTQLGIQLQSLLEREDLGTAPSQWSRVLEDELRQLARSAVVV